jgi:Sulfatase
MTGWLQVAAGLGLASAAWLIPRRVAGARIAGLSTVVLDISPVLLAGGLLLMATGRPIFTGVVLLSLGAGFALADQTKRDALREPIVFSEMSEVRHVFTHPHLYLPFAGPGLVIGGALATIALGLVLLVLEPALWRLHLLPLVLVLTAASAIGRTLSREPALGAAAAALRRLDPSGEPFADAAKLGPFALLAVYGVIARAERGGRRARHLPAPAPALIKAAPAIPLVVVQCESFFDVRRLSPRVPSDLLPGFDECVQRCAAFGRLDVGAWGANTMRAEFAVLTGIPEADLGYDRFNPYHAFARVPIASLVRRLRGEGYRTICLHPFDRGFFGRDVTLRALGFETFLGRESLGGSRRPPYCSDPDLARLVLGVLKDTGPRTFIFAITMGNHGPWLDAGPPLDPGQRQWFDPAALPQGVQLLRYLAGLARSDEMLQILAEGLGPSRANGVLGFYGDHLPSLPRAFDHLGFDEWASDYVLLDGTPPRARRLDLPAHRLPQIILDCLHQRGAIDLRRVAAIGAA